MSKNIVPCGGFNLDKNFLGMNENGELSLTSGSEDKAYKQLVTDREGRVKWEDKIIYVNISSSDGETFTADKTFDEIKKYINGGFYVFCMVNIKNLFPFVIPYTRYGTEEDYEFYVFSGCISPYGRNFKIISISIAMDNLIMCDINTIVVGDGWGNNASFLQISDNGDVYATKYPTLRSSTPGSKKKFFLKIDDSGAISTTEVT